MSKVLRTEPYILEVLDKCGLFLLLQILKAYSIVCDDTKT